MKKTISLLLALCLVLALIPAAYAADYTFTDRNGKTRTVKDGEYSFATRVVEFTPGDPWTKVERNMDPVAVLGQPDYVENFAGPDDLTLGVGGVLVVEFNVSIVDGEGEDVYVFEAGPSVESTKVEVSSDLVTWYEVGIAKGKTAGLDINGKVPEGGRFRYVRLTDMRSDTGGSTPGADIDAVLALNSRPVSAPWAEDEIDKAKEYDLVPEILEGAVMTEPITRLEFAAVSVKTYEALTGTKLIPATVNPFEDCDDLELLKAYAANIVNGTSKTTFSPDENLNREQAATMLTRVFKRVTVPGWTLETDSQFKLPYAMPAPFADDSDISGWARDSVYFMAANGIIKGNPGNVFAPRNVTPAQTAKGYANATREQALAIAVRMVEYSKNGQAG